MDLSNYDMTNVPGFMKHKKTGVVINTNNGQYQMILAQRQKAKTEKILEQRVEELEKQVSFLLSKIGI